MADILFTGFGDLGSAAGTLLRAAGHAVTALKRRDTGEVSGVRYRYLDLTRPFTLDTRPDAVVIAVSPAGRDEAAYRQAYTGITGNLLEALRAASAAPKLVLYVSSTAVYGDDPARLQDEDTPPAPAGYNGRVMLEAEQLLRDSGLPHCCLRLAGIYGPGRLWLVRQVDALLAGGDWPAPAFTNRIHRDDAARLVAFLIERALAGAPVPDTLIGVDDAPVLNHEVLGWIAVQRGVMIDAPGPYDEAPGGKRLSNARLHALGFALEYPDYLAGYAHGVPAG
jgi:nucleoside-diphosphate-sugar epimerase